MIDDRAPQVALLTLLISILLPSLSRARELSKRVVCSSNLSGIGKSCKIYANDNEELWPIPAHDTSLVSATAQRVKYVGEVQNDGANGPQDNVNPNRATPSAPGTSTSTPAASNQISTTRAFWMLVRAGDVQPKSFICPSSSDQVDPTAEIDSFYDFEGPTNVSYGYQVPFGPAQTRPSENLDSRMAMAADKGPWYDTGLPSGTSTFPDEKSSPNDWRQFNSGNHGGKGGDPHKAAVVGDTVGDPLKDTSGPSLNILMKLMAILSLMFAPLFVEHGGVLFRMLGVSSGIK